MIVVLSIAGVLTAGLGLATVLQRRLYFPRHLTSAPVDPGEVPGRERWWLDTPAGRVEAWYIPGAGATPATPAPAVIFMHGNAEVIDHWPALLAVYHRWGLGLLLPEYRGYGRSAGSPSQAAIGHDMMTWAERLSHRPEVSTLIYHGRSIGGGVACDLALRRRPQVLILQSTFRSLRAMARRMLLPGWLVLDSLDNEAAVRQLGDLPVLIIHGEQDRLIPFSHARHLAQAARQSTLVPFAGGHNDTMESNAYWQAIAGVLERAGITVRAW